jgi:Rab-like protein 2
LSRQVTSKKFKFSETHNLPFEFVSAADGTNVVKVFKDAVAAAWKFKQDGGDFMSDVLDLLGESSACFVSFSFHSLTQEFLML